MLFAARNNYEVANYYVKEIPLGYEEEEKAKEVLEAQFAERTLLNRQECLASLNRLEITRSDKDLFGLTEKRAKARIQSPP